MSDIKQVLDTNNDELMKLKINQSPSSSSKQVSSLINEGASPNPTSSNSGNSSGSGNNESTGNGKALQSKIFTQNTRHPNGGWKFIDEIELKKQRGVCWELVKSVGNSIIEGKELTNTCLPIALFEPRSFLEKITDTWGYGPYFLPKAATTSDPVERMKYLVSFTISGLHLTSSLTKPFNPLLGETFQSHFYDGTRIFCEQTSHHPPISNWEMVCPNNTFHYFGHGIWSAACRGNIVKGYQKGRHEIRFQDGSTIHWTLPDLLIKGIFWGDRVTEFSGKIVFVDEKNQLGCEVTFNPHALGFIRGIFSKQKEPSDYFFGHIYKISEQNIKSSAKRLENENVCTVEGSWLNNISFDQKVYWDIKTVPSGIIYDENPLPTDSRYREDLRYLKEGNIEKAKEFKALIEDRQRSEAKLRKQSKKK